MVHCFVSTRLITHAKQLLEDNEEALCVRVLQTIKGMMACDIDFGDKVSITNIYCTIYSQIGQNSISESVLCPRCWSEALLSNMTYADNVKLT